MLDTHPVARSTVAAAAIQAPISNKCAWCKHMGAVNHFYSTTTICLLLVSTPDVLRVSLFTAII